MSLTSPRSLPLPPLSQDLESTALSSLIHTSLLPCIRLNLLPKASLDIYISILESDASLEGCASLAITAASASLASAGIEMWGLCVGSSAALVDVDGEGEGGHAQKGRGRRTLVDPTREEAADSSGTVALCSMPALGSITSLEQSGRVSFEELDQVSLVLDTQAVDTVYTYIALTSLCFYRSSRRSPRRRRRSTSWWQKHCRRWSHRVGPSSILSSCDPRSFEYQTITASQCSLTSVAKCETKSS